MRTSSPRTPIPGPAAACCADVVCIIISAAAAGEAGATAGVGTVAAPAAVTASMRHLQHASIEFKL